jgi:general stress protein 26
MQPISPDALEPEERNKIYQFLKSHPIGVLASVAPNGDPHASTIYFSIYDDLTISFTTKRTTKKYENIQSHKKVMLAVYDGESQTAVQLSGDAIEITDEVEAQSIYHGTLRAAKTTGEDVVPPVAKILGAYVGYKIKPDNIHFSEYGWGNNFKNALQHAQDPLTTNDPS